MYYQNVEGHIALGSVNASRIVPTSMNYKDTNVVSFLHLN
jgi:hypothetical protein